jgi:MraZ protein
LVAAKWNPIPTQGNPVAFRGEYIHAVDDKGRVIVPLKFRTELGSAFVITKGIGGCLFIYRERDFQEIEQRLQSQPVLDQHALRMKRWLFASANDLQVDSQGRIAIPSALRSFAGIAENTEAVIAGTGEKIEVWSKSAWNDLNAGLDEDAIIESARFTGLGTSL